MAVLLVGLVQLLHHVRGHDLPGELIISDTQCQEVSRGRCATL